MEDFDKEDAGIENQHAMHQPLVGRPPRRAGTFPPRAAQHSAAHNAFDILGGLGDGMMGSDSEATDTDADQGAGGGNSGEEGDNGASSDGEAAVSEGGATEEAGSGGEGRDSGDESDASEEAEDIDPDDLVEADFNLDRCAPLVALACKVRM